MAKKTMPDTLLSLIDWLDALGFEATSTVIREGWGSEDPIQTILRDAHKDIDWHEEQVGELETKPVFAAARTLVTETKKLVALEDENDDLVREMLGVGPDADLGRED